MSLDVSTLPKRGHVYMWLTLCVLIPHRPDVLDATLYDKLCQWLAADRWLFPNSPVSSPNKTDNNDITEILLKVALSTITLSPLSICVLRMSYLYVLLRFSIRLDLGYYNLDLSHPSLSISKLRSSYKPEFGQSLIILLPTFRRWK